MIAIGYGLLAAAYAVGALGCLVLSVGYMTH